MVEPQEHTLYRNWPLVRKASSPAEARDWYNEYKDYEANPDAEIQSIIPANIVIPVLIAETTTPAQNAIALNTAYDQARLTSPTETSQVIVKVPPGDYDFVNQSFVMDTDWIHVICEQNASRGEWQNKPLWTSEVQKAGARLTSDATTNGVLSVTANNCIIGGLDVRQSVTAAEYSVKTNCTLSATTGPTFIGCSFHNWGIELQTACANRFYNCHTEGEFAGEQQGVYIGCSAVDRRSFDRAGSAYSTIVEDCSITYAATALYEAAIDTAIFTNCRFFGDAILGWENSTVPASGDTSNTEFHNCYFEGTSVLGTTTTINDFSAAQFYNCVFALTSRLGLGVGASAYNCDITVTGGVNEAVSLIEGVDTVAGTSIFNDGGPNGVTAFSPLTTPVNLIGCTVKAGTTGIAVGLNYIGGNIDNTEWVDTGTSAPSAHAPSHALGGSDPYVQCQFDGCILDEQTSYVVVDAGAVYLELEKLGGGDLRVQLAGAVYTLDCTTGAGVGGRARVALTEGTAVQAVLNFGYVYLDGGIATLGASTLDSLPIAVPFAYAAYIAIWDDVKTAADGPAGHLSSIDAPSSVSIQGREHVIGERLRRGGAKYGYGIASTATIDTVPAPDTVNLTTTAGAIAQPNRYIFPALDVSIDGAYVANASGAGTLVNFQKALTLGDFLEDSAGNSLSGSRYNLIIFGVVSQTTGECKLYVNLPSSGYTAGFSDEDVYNDISNTAITGAPESLYYGAFLICRIPLEHTASGGGQFNFINPAGSPEIVDLRATPIGFGAGGGASGTGGEANIAVNDGAGIGLAKSKVGITLPFKSIIAGQAMDITTDEDHVTFSSTVGAALAGETWRFSSDITDTDPGNRNFKLNNAIQANATQMNISVIADSGADVSVLLSLLGTGDYIYAQDFAESSQYQLYEITSDPIDVTTFYRIPITSANSGADLVNNRQCRLVFKSGTSLIIWNRDPSGFITPNTPTDTLRLTDGTPAAPAYSFISDPTAGMAYNNIDDSIALALSDRQLEIIDDPASGSLTIANGDPDSVTKTSRLRLSNHRTIAGDDSEIVIDASNDVGDAIVDIDARASGIGRGFVQINSTGDGATSSLQAVSNSGADNATVDLFASNSAGTANVNLSTLGSVGSANVSVNGLVELGDRYRAASNWLTFNGISLSESSTEWNDIRTLLGDTEGSLFAAILAAAAAGGSAGELQYIGSMMGSANSTPGILSKHVANQSNPSPLGLTGFSNYTDGSIDPYVVVGNQEVIEITVVCGAAAVAQGSVGAQPTFRVAFYSHEGTSRALIGNVDVPLGPAGVATSNNLGGNTIIKNTYTLPSPLALADETVMGFWFANRSGTDEEISAASEILVSVKTRRT